MKMDNQGNAIVENLLWRLGSARLPFIFARTSAQIQEKRNYSINRFLGESR